MRFFSYCLFLFGNLIIAQTIPCFSFDENEFVVSGNATIINEDTVRLTEAIGNQAGFIWSQNLVNFEQNFNLEAELFLGNQDFGADGIAFVIQPISNDEGSLGGGIGYAGISPSIAIEFDTWWNSGADPIQDDHVALIANGLPWDLSAHSAYVPYVGVNNLEDGQWHPISIIWEADEKILNLNLDNELIFSSTLDIPNLFFNGDPNLYWGFTAATGGANNLQQVKILEFCSLDSNCNTVPPTANSPQFFCESVNLENIQTSGQNIKFYSDQTGETQLDLSFEIFESSSIYITQTIEDCESQDLVEIEIIIENPIIHSDNFEIVYCESNNPEVNLFDASELFLSSNFSGFFNSQNDAETIENVISTPNSFNITLENQIIFARIENDICYEIYQIILIPENCDIIIPNGISPNGDGFNDLFEIQNLYGVHLNHTLKIFNRYGVCVFNGDNNLKWDGTSDDGDLVPVGTYFYVLNLNNDEEKSVFTGWVYCNY